MCRGLYLICISLVALLIMIMYEKKNLNNKEKFYGGRVGSYSGGHGGYTGGGGHGGGHGGGGHGGGGRYYGGGGGGGYGYRSWWDPYYYSWGNWFPYSDYSVYSGSWRQCPQGSICPPYLSCNDPYCQ